MRPNASWRRRVERRRVNAPSRHRRAAPRRSVRRSFSRAALALAAAVLGASIAFAAEPIPLAFQPVPLERSEPPAGAVGRLHYRGGLKITSSDKRFGGLSGLVVTEDGARLLAVSDMGDWLSARLLYDQAGRLAGIDDGMMGRLVGRDVRPLAHRRSEQDAESLTALSNGDLIVTFERQHRIWRYPASDPPFARPPQPIGNPPEIESAPPNEGIEAFSVLSDGTYFAVAEGLAHPGGGLMAWTGDGTRWRTMAFAPQGTFRPTDAKATASGDVMVIERRFNPIEGAGVRLRLIARTAIQSTDMLAGDELAVLAPPMAVDNFEGLALRRSPSETLIYILSDDNFSPAQSTLLLMFALPDQR